MKKEFSLIGTVDLQPRTLRVKCVPCDREIGAKEEGFLYFDELAHQLLVFCVRCHKDPAKARELMYQDHE